VASSRPLTVTYDTGHVPLRRLGEAPSVEVRIRTAQPAQPEIAAVATDRFLDSVGAREGQRVDVTFAGQNVPVRIVHSVRGLPTTGPGQSGSVDAVHDGGGLLMDLRAVNRLLQTHYADRVGPTEWWLDTDARHTADV